jgi:hypothetical protein
MNELLIKHTTYITCFTGPNEKIRIKTPPSLVYVQQVLEHLSNYAVAASWM